MITLDGSTHLDLPPADPARTLRLIVDMVDEIRRLRSERDAARKEADAKGYRLDAAIDERRAVIVERNAAEAHINVLQGLIDDYVDSQRSGDLVKRVNAHDALVATSDRRNIDV